MKFCQYFFYGKDITPNWSRLQKVLPVFLLESKLQIKEKTNIIISYEGLLKVDDNCYYYYYHMVKFL